MMNKESENNDHVDQVDERFIEAVSIPYIEHEQVGLRFTFIEEDIDAVKDSLFDPTINTMLYQDIVSKVEDSSYNSIEKELLNALPEQFTCYKEQHTNNRTNAHYSFMLVNNQTKRIILVVSVRDYIYEMISKSPSRHVSIWSTHIGHDHRIAMDALDQLFARLVESSTRLLIANRNHFREYRRLYAKLMFMAIYDMGASCTLHELHKDTVSSINADNLDSLIDSLENKNQYFCIQR